MAQACSKRTFLSSSPVILKQSCFSNSCTRSWGSFTVSQKRRGVIFLKLWRGPSLRFCLFLKIWDFWQGSILITQYIHHSLPINLLFLNKFGLSTLKNGHNGDRLRGKVESIKLIKILFYSNSKIISMPIFVWIKVINHLTWSASPPLPGGLCWPPTLPNLFNKDLAISITNCSSCDRSWVVPEFRNMLASLLLLRF